VKEKFPPFLVASGGFQSMVHGPIQPGEPVFLFLSKFKNRLTILFKVAKNKTRH